MPVSSKFDPNLLHVVCCISNPVRYNTRYSLYNRFNQEMQAAGANLLTVEGAFGSRVHEITPPIHGKHLQLRTEDEIWHKENLLNLRYSNATARLEICGLGGRRHFFFKP